MKRLARLLFGLLKILVFIVLISFILIRIDALPIGAVEYARVQFGRNPELETRLGVCASLGTMAQPLLRPAETITQGIEYAKALGVWDDLKEGTPLASSALDALDLFVARAAKSVEKFADMEELDDVADAVAAFKVESNWATLQLLSEHCDKGIVMLSDAQPQLIGFSSSIHTVYGGYSVLLAGLQSAKERGPIIALVVELLNPALRDLQQHLATWDQRIQSVADHVGGDIETLRAVHVRVAAVTTVAQIADTLPLWSEARVAARYVWTHLDWALYAVITLLVVGLLFGRSPATPRARVAPPQAQRVELASWLVQRTAPASNRMIALPSQGAFTIGSEAGCDLQIHSALPRHCAISAARTCYYAESLQSGADVLINGVPLTAARKLQHGDTLMVRGVELLYLNGQAMRSST